MIMSSNFATAAQTYTYQVTITAPPCAYTESTNPVSYYLANSIQIDPFEVTDSSGDPACIVVAITCTQTSPASPNLCTDYSSYNSST